MAASCPSPKTGRSDLAQAATKSRNFLSLALPLIRRNPNMACGSVEVSHSRSSTASLLAQQQVAGKQRLDDLFAWIAEHDGEYRLGDTALQVYQNWVRLVALICRARL